MSSESGITRRASDRRSFRAGTSQQAAACRAQDEGSNHSQVELLGLWRSLGHTTRVCHKTARDTAGPGLRASSAVGTRRLTVHSQAAEHLLFVAAKDAQGQGQGLGQGFGPAPHRSRARPRGTARAARPGARPGGPVISGVIQTATRNRPRAVSGPTASIWSSGSSRNRRHRRTCRSSESPGGATSSCGVRVRVRGRVRCRAQRRAENASLSRAIPVGRHVGQNLHGSVINIIGCTPTTSYECRRPRQ